MDIKDNEHVLDTNHYRRVVEEYEKNYMNDFSETQKQEAINMGKNSKVRNVSKQKERRGKKTLPEKVKSALAIIATSAIVFGVGYGISSVMEKADYLQKNGTPLGVDFESVEDMSDIQRFYHWVDEQNRLGGNLDYNEEAYDLYSQIVLGKTSNPGTGARK